METPKIKLKTQFIHPPIPIRFFDWVAWDDNDPETYAHGRTEEDAIQALQDLVSDN